MAKAPKKPLNEVVVEETEVAEVKPVTYEVAVLHAADERGLKSGSFELVDVKFLWGNNYRINCYKERKIVASHFISYSNKEGIYFCVPEILNVEEKKERNCV